MSYSHSFIGDNYDNYDNYDELERYLKAGITRKIKKIRRNGSSAKSKKPKRKKTKRSRKSKRKKSKPKHRRYKKNKTKKMQSGGLKPTSESIRLNEHDAQVDNTKLNDFYALMEEAGIKYPPSSFASSTLHSEKPEFSRDSIEYPILNMNASGDEITIDTSKRGIIGLSEEDTKVISPETPVHRDHEYNPKRVQATIKGNTIFVKSITPGREQEPAILTFFESIIHAVGEGDTVTISRNRKGDFIIYTTEPTTIRYLDHQAQADYLSRGGELKLGHFSLLKQPSDYEQVARSSNETYGQRSTDRILYAGTITWRHDGKALFYNNDCGRYQPDEKDTAHLANINVDFKKDLETATGEETGSAEGPGNPKLFYRPHDHKSSVERRWECKTCHELFKIQGIRKARDEWNYCYQHFPIQSIAITGGAGCGSCEACRFGVSEHCLNEGKSAKALAWEEGGFPKK
tara:strand:+ start:1311 stop:2687 length:1377 start_codon:yes stop_codon:yes gene_type:complete